MGDWDAADYIVEMRIRGGGGGGTIPAEERRTMKERHVSGVGTYPSFADAGLDGIAVGLVNYIDEFPIVRDENLPRLERLGVRARAGPES